jgi:hypothetical protein
MREVVNRERGVTEYTRYFGRIIKRISHELFISNMPMAKISWCNSNNEVNEHGTPNHYNTAVLLHFLLLHLP